MESIYQQLLQIEFLLTLTF